MKTEFNFNFNKTLELNDHFSLIKSFIEYSKKNKNIKAVGIGGSFACNEADRWSDIDLYPLISQNLQISKANFIIEDWAFKNKKFISSCERGFKNGFGFVVQCIFYPLIKIDLNINNVKSLTQHQLWKNRRILFDKDGLFESFLSQQKTLWDIKQIKKDYENSYIRFQDMFWIEYIKAYKCVQRKSYWSSIFYIDRLREILFHFIRLYYNIYSDNPDRPFKSMEKQFNNSLNNKELNKTLPTYSKQSISNCLFHIVQLFEEFIDNKKKQNCLLRKVVLDNQSPQSLLD